MKLILAIGRTSAGDHWILRLGGPGIVLHLLFLLSAILVLMNLERTFRSSVGTMRWRIKFMILEGHGSVSLKYHPDETRALHAGQMIMVRPAATKLPEPQNVDLPEEWLAASEFYGFRGK